MKLNLFFLSAAALLNAASAQDAVVLGAAAGYVILAQTGISTVPDSVVTGNIAVSPIDATAITGFSLIKDSSGTFSTASQLSSGGKAFASNYVSPSPSELTTAVSDMQTAYTDAAGRLVTAANYTNVAGGLVGGLTLTPGVYKFTTDILISSDLTLHGDNNLNDVFIIQTTGNVNQASATNVILTGTATAANVFWQVAGTVAVGANAKMQGVIMAKTDVTFITGSELIGRVLTQTRCDLQKATITQA
jgi:hypothetical protein